MSDKWMACSTCRVDIDHGATHYVCSVSTCNRDRTRLVFCSVVCWDSHVAVLRHRDAWAVEAEAPTRGAVVSTLPSASMTTAALPVVTAVPPQPPARHVVAPAPAPAPSSGGSGEALGEASTDDILIVVSKMKKYIKDRSGMSTADAVTERLSDHVRAVCDQAIRTAAAAGRKTVLDRDVPPIRK